MYKLLYLLFKRPIVRVKKYDGTWITRMTLKTEDGYFVKYFEEVGKLLPDGKIDTAYFIYEWKPFIGKTGIGNDK